jgi:hypothetical protein
VRSKVGHRRQRRQDAMLHEWRRDGSQVWAHRWRHCGKKESTHGWLSDGELAGDGTRARSRGDLGEDGLDRWVPAGGDHGTRNGNMPTRE